MGEKRNACKVMILKLEGMHKVGEIGVVWRIILKSVFEKLSLDM
jgi:hypothetical protein